MRNKGDAMARLAVITVTVIVALMFTAAAMVAHGNSIDDKLLIIGCIVGCASVIILPAWFCE